MNDHDLIDPIVFFKPGQCPYCSGILMVVDSEISCMLLGSDGMPVKEDVQIRCEGVCQSCGKTFPMIRHGFGYREYTPSFEIIREYDLLQERKLQHTKVEGNPFVKKD